MLPRSLRYRFALQVLRISGRRRDCPAYGCPVVREAVAFESSRIRPWIPLLTDRVRTRPIAAGPLPLAAIRLGRSRSRGGSAHRASGGLDLDPLQVACVPPPARLGGCYLTRTWIAGRCPARNGLSPPGRRVRARRLRAPRRLVAATRITKLIRTPTHRSFSNIVFSVLPRRRERMSLARR